MTVTSMGHCGHGYSGRSPIIGHVQHDTDLQAGNGDRGSAGKNGPLDRHLQDSRESHAQVGQHGRRHQEGATGDKVSGPN